MMPRDHLQAAAHVMGLKGETILCPMSGNCMAPMLREGDSLLVKFGNEDIRPGDIVVVGSPGDLRVQRVVSASGREGTATFILKGDLRGVVHPPIPRDRILGQVIEAHGSNGHVRFESAFWRSLNYLLWLRSYVSVRRLQADTVFWRGTNSILALRARFFPRRYSISLLPMKLMCWFGKLRSDVTRGRQSRKSGG